jgi:uncharacterized protein (TIGR00255 family)
MKELRSMTGYGNAERETTRFGIKAEFKALNGKYLEVSIRLPKFLNEWEQNLRQHFQKKLGRGSVNLNIYILKAADMQEAQKLNTPLAEHYLREFSSFADANGLSKQDLFRSILMQPDILQADELKFDDSDWAEVLLTCDEAFAQFDQFRLQEGAATAAEMLEILKRVRSEVEKLQAFEEERIQSVRDRIGKALEKSAQREDIDENRFEQEMIYYLEKLDISEEKSRLLSHIEHFENSMSKPQCGKTLGFIAQEMGREINTIGSKSNHAEMQKCVVSMKDELEKIKEQVLNIL